MSLTASRANAFFNAGSADALGGELIEVAIPILFRLLKAFGKLCDSAPLQKDVHPDIARNKLRSPN